MGSPGLDMDLLLSELRREWRRAHEISVASRADYRSIAADPHSDVERLDRAHERFDRAEAFAERILLRIERLEAGILDGEMAE
jgi:hypothetical protein